VNIRFACPVCDEPGRVQIPAAEWHCPTCDHVLRPVPVEPGLTTCVICGNHELYKKKDFPHALGLGLLALACLVSTFTYATYNQVWTWSILLGSAAFDALLYLWVGDAIVCYRCGAEYRGVAPSPEHKPFELTVHERYRQERIRREQLGQN
jgi:hypothetical protein